MIRSEETFNGSFPFTAQFSTAEECIGALGWAKGFAIGAHVFEVPREEVRIGLSKVPALAIWGGGNGQDTTDKILYSAFQIGISRWIGIQIGKIKCRQFISDATIYPTLSSY